MSPERERPRFAEFGPPRRVDGGLRARSTRGAIGRSWWSRRFLEVLESFALGTRLTRGRAYARKGQVLRLDVAPGRVTANVQGSRPDPYPVRIGLAAYPDEVWDRIEADLAGQAFFSARLLAGDLPPELEQLFAAAGAPLFPADVDELDQRCGCPDFAVPCKHLAATFYLLAEAFDADPFQLLHWRGRSRAELLGRLRTLRGGDATAGGAAVDRAATPDGAGGPAGGRPRPEPVAGAGRVLGGLPAPEDEVDRFWLPPVPLPDRPPTLATGPELLLRQLGPPGPELGGPGLVERLRRAYREFGRPRPAADPDGPAAPTGS
ncbi:SWIM zinc finger family protein [Micromonospora yasonensis]|uniref:SWIM zinc finger family protein n=1 Tax=Micromonospora yasonensis TaxID=1128667 RepID=UPI00222F1B9A|nr:SWIM zinc finger family protein [Micromonospora yasonensis]MCW3840323.1 SWIM zinc finger family protein [Micromonospora yasonensis]